MKINIRSLVRWKIYLDRARVYVSLIQFLLIGIVLIKSVGGDVSRIFFQHAILTIPLAVIAILAISLFIGYLDTKIGFRSEELRNISETNPVIMEILELLKKENDKDSSSH
jgi:hypothetical protein